MALREQKERLIGNNTYQVTQLGAVQGSKIFVRVAKLLGPLILSKGSDISAAMSAVTEDDLTYLCDVFGPMTIVGGRVLDKQFFDIHFVANYKEMFLWLAFCLEVNYGDFLKGSALGALVAGQAQGVSGSAFPTTSTGRSGVS